MSTLTVPEAAALVGVSTETVQSWVKRGHLRPVRYMQLFNERRFREDDVIDCWQARRSKAQRRRLDQLSEEWERQVRDLHHSM